MNSATMVEKVEPMKIQSWVDSLGKEELLAAFEKLSLQTEENLYKLACLYVRAKREGWEIETPSCISSSILRALDAIYCGTLDAGVMCKYLAYPGFINRIKCYPIEEQQRLAKADGLEVVVFDSNGGFTDRMLPYATMAPEQKKQVFARDHVRTKQEQIAFLENERTDKILQSKAKSKIKPQVEVIYKGKEPYLVIERGVGDVVLSRDDVLGFLQRMK